MSLLIAPYSAADCNAVACVWMASWLSWNPPHVAANPSVQSLAARLPHEIACGWSVYLGWRESKLVAFLAMEPASAYLAQLFVAPSAQNVGVGAAMLAFAKRRLPDGLWLATAVENAGARRFYERHGFRAGETHAHPRMGHKTIDYHWRRSVTKPRTFAAAAAKR